MICSTHPENARNNMTYVKYDMTGMRALIDDLNDRAAEIDTQRRRIRDCSTRNHDPVPDAALALDKSSGQSDAAATTNMGASASAVEQIAFDLKERHDVIVEINRLGISDSFNSGTLTYYIPDDQDDTVANMRTFNVDAAQQARSEAEESKTLTGDDLLSFLTSKVHSGQNNPIYAAVFADTLGAEGMANLAESVQTYWELWQQNPATNGTEDIATKFNENQERYFSALSTLSNTLGMASTSQIWTPQHKQKYAHSLASLINDDGTPPYMPYAVNLLLSGANHSATNTIALGDATARAGGVFDSEFLSTIAKDLQENEQKSSGVPSWEMKMMANMYPMRRMGDWDPFTGLLTAMGRNPEAALNYFVPPSEVVHGDNGYTVEDSPTFRWIMSRHWDETSMEGLTAAFAGVSTFRVPDEGSKDEQAAWITEQATLALSGLSNKSKFNPTWSPLSRQNTAIMLGNSMPDVDAAARKSDASQPSSPSEKSYPKVWSAVRTKEVRALLQEVGTDDTALATLGEAASRFCAERTKADSDIKQYTNSSAETAVKQIGRDCGSNDWMIGFILGAAQKGRELDKKEEDAGINFLFSALSNGLKFIPSPQSAALGSAISIAQSYALDYTKSVVTSSSSGSTAMSGSATSESEDDPNGDFYESAWRAQNIASAFNALAEAGLIPDDAYLDANGQRYSYLKADGTIDMDKFTIEANGSNIETVADYFSDLNNLSEDSDFDVWGAEDTSRKTAYKLGVDEGRND